MPVRDYIGLVLSATTAGAIIWACSVDLEQLIMKDVMAIPGGKFKFLTILNLYLHIIYYVICIINFFFGTNTIVSKEQSMLQKLRDFIFAGAAFPIGTFVLISFWGLYLVDPKLIVPEEIEQFLPPILNHIMHTLPAVAIWCENLFHYHLYPSRLSGILCITTITVAYTAWLHYLNYIHWLNSNTNLWIYPVLNELSVFYRILFLLGSLLFCIGLYLIGEMYTLFLTALRFDKAERNKKRN